MNRAAAQRNPATTSSRRRSLAFDGVIGVAVLALVVTACGGDDDDGAAAESTTTTTSAVASLPPVTAAPTTSAAPATTAPPTTAALDLVTEGATVIVANASGIDGAAGRMTDALAIAGFATGSATNSTESQLETTKVYYDPENPDARAVADSVKAALGGGEIEVLELTVPAPLTDPEAIGDAGVLVAMGNDTADRTLEDLQGGVTEPEDTTPDDTSDA